eukprot:1120058-Alexandrium_andersonii.AAC.1
MSASLVGSEMCIRDRARRALLPGRTLCLLSPPGSTAMLLPTDREDDVGAVSYTHLTLPTICSV